MRGRNSQMDVFKVLGREDLLTFWHSKNFSRRQSTVYNHHISVLWDLLVM